MSRPRILSIDDEVGFIEMIRQYFEPRKYPIDITSDSGKGLELLRANVYDVVLLDLRMTELKGDQIMRYIKQLNLNTKVIFITAYSDSGRTKERLMAAGAYAFVEKPIMSLKFLEDIVNEAVEVKEQGGERC